MSARPWPALSLVILLLRCGGGGGGGGTTPAPSAPAPVPSPALLPPSVGGAQGALSLQWFAPSGAIDGFELEGRFGTGTYQKAHPGQLSAATTSYTITLPSNLPESTDCAFRVRAMRGADTSPYSNEVTYHKPLTTPSQPTGVYDWAAGGTALTWITTSSVADGFTVQRAECTSGGSPLGGWALVEAVAGRAGSYLDRTAKLGTYYLYRITHTKGSEASAEGPTSSVISTLVPAPTQLTATFDPARGGVSLVWGSTFAQADGLLLERAEATSDGQPFGSWTGLTLPNGTGTAFLDTQVQEATSYLYRISNVLQSVDSLPILAAAAVTVPPSTPTALSATFDFNVGAPVLAWTANSTRNTGVRIERAEADTSGLPTTAWTALSSPLGPLTTFMDRGATEFTRYVYRVTNLLGSLPGLPSSASASLTTPLAAPSQVVATVDVDLNRVNLTWRANSTHATNVLVERAQVDANGLPASTWSMLTTYGTGTTYADSSFGELSAYIYRITNLASGVPSPASTPSPLVQTPLAPASYISVYYDSYSQGANIYWSSPFSNDRTYLLDRAESDAAGTPLSGWTRLAVPSGYQSNAFDTGVTEAKYYVYRIAISKDAYTTPFRQTPSPIQPPLKAPAQVVATSRMKGVDLSWTNASTAATSVIIRRSVAYTSTDVAVLSPTATSYSDTNLPMGSYTYQVVAKKGTLEAASANIRGITLNDADALALSATNLSIPPAADAALLAMGSWIYATSYPFEIPSGGNPWVDYYPTGASRLGNSLIKVDVGGHPHSLYLVQSSLAPANNVLRHLWHDGTAWQTEDMFEGPFSSSGSAPFQWVLDSSSRPQALVNSSSTYSNLVGNLRHIHYAAGVWQVDSLANAGNAAQSFLRFDLSLEAADAPHVLTQIAGDAVDLTPNGSGGWTSTTLSTENLSTYPSPFLQCVWTDAANGWCFYTTADNAYPTTVSLKVRQKVAGVWQPTVLLGTHLNGSQEATALACSDAGRTKALIAFNTGVGLKAYHYANGTWHETLVHPYPTYGLWYRLGLDGSGHFHALVQYSNNATTYVDYHE